MNVQEMNSALKGLQTEYGIEVFETPSKTYEKRTVLAGRVGGKKSSPHKRGGGGSGGGHAGDRCARSASVFFNGAIHARERGSSDNILYFLGDLLYANKKKTGVAWGGRTYTYEEVKKALSVGIVFIPLSNPDGVAWDQAHNDCWRKNRNPASAVAGDPASIGVDLNRNFDFLFDFPRLFAPDVAPNVASLDPAAADFHGVSPFSEPETQNIRWIADTFPELRYFLDVHSFTGIVLYNWGSDENQAKLPHMNFQNGEYDDERGKMPDVPANRTVYGEFLKGAHWRDKVYAAMRVGNAMDAATGRHYEVAQSAYLYPTSGASDDYMYSRHFADRRAGLVHGFAVEFGFGNEEADCPFYPTEEQYHLNLLETNAGFMEFLLAAGEIGLGEKGGC
jgi:murein tripeptide amidase MpaA